MAKETTLKERIKLYGGAVEIDFFPNSHRYKRLGDKSYIASASSYAGMIDPFNGMDWALGMTKSHLLSYLEKSKIDNFTKNELIPVIDDAIKASDVYTQMSIDIGNEIHKLCEAFAVSKINKTEFDYSILDTATEMAVNGFNHFADWYKNNDVVFLESEKLVYSKDLNIVGTTDLVAMVNGIKTIVDYKSGTLYPKQRIQNSVYLLCYNEEWLATVGTLAGCAEQGIVLHLPREGDCAVPVLITSEEYTKDYNCIKAMVVVKERSKELSKLK